MKRDLVSIEDLSNSALLHLMEVADGLRLDLRGHKERLSGLLMGSLFAEPSTRTRLSFEAAMARLGGRFVTSSDPATSSAVKGETLSDTIRIVDSYVDLTVLRHPRAGAARWAARHASGPVVNAGDGAREHPTQTLCDLYTLRAEKGRIDGLTVMLYGDLRFGRTTHSLARALARFGARILAVAEPGLELPDGVVEDLVERSAARCRPLKLKGLVAGIPFAELSALLIECGTDGLWGDEFDFERTALDAVYVTRLQTERLQVGLFDREGYALPPIEPKLLRAAPFEDAIIMHPLPRRREIAPEVDQDPRAAYFRQAALGVPIRMALLLWLAGRIDLPVQSAPSDAIEPTKEARCENPQCITQVQEECVPREFGRRAGGTIRCLYCEHVAVPGL